MNTPMGSNYIRGGVKKLSEYNKFVKKMFPVLKAQHPDKKATEIFKLVAKEWKTTKKPVTKKPAAKKPATKKPATKK